MACHNTPDAQGKFVPKKGKSKEQRLAEEEEKRRLERERVEAEEAEKQKEWLGTLSSIVERLSEAPPGESACPFSAFVC